MARLKQHRWPGNVRELVNLVRRLSALYSEEVIGVETIEAVGELIAGPLGLGGVEEFVVAEGPVDGLVEDLDVGEEGEGRAVFESGAGGLDGVGELCGSSG